MKKTAVSSILITVFIASVLYGEDESLILLEQNYHRAAVTDVLFTPDGEEIVSCSLDGTIRIYNAETGEPNRVIRGQTDSYGGGLNALAINPKGTVLAAGGRTRGKIRIIDYGTGEILYLLIGPDEIVDSLAFSPEGRYLAAGYGDGTVIVWKTSSFSYAFRPEPHNSNVFGLAFSPDGLKLATASDDGTVRISSVSSGRTIAVRGDAHSGFFVNRVVWSPDGSVLTTSGYDGTVKSWDGETFEYIRTVFRVPGGHTAEIAYLPEGTLLAGGTQTERSGTGTVNPVYILDTDGSSPVRTYNGHTGNILRIAVSPDGKKVVSSGGKNYDILVWNPKNLKTEIIISGPDRPVYRIGFGEDEKSIYWNSSSAAEDKRPERGFSLNKGELLTNIPLWDKITTELKHVDGSELLFTGKPGDSSFTVRRPEGKKEIVQLLLPGDTVRSGTFTPDGKYIFIASDYGISKYDSDTLKIVNIFQGHDGTVLSLSVSSDGKFLASGGSDRTIRFWDPESGLQLLTLYIAGKEWIALSKDGFFDCSSGGGGLAGYLINRGEDKSAGFQELRSDERGKYRPGLIGRILSGESPESGF